MAVLLHPTYFPSIWTGAIVAQNRNINWEQNDNYQKQTFRNRTRILSPTGALELTVPVQFTQKNRQLYRDVLISEDHAWKLKHWKSITNSYSNSPFFEFYKDDIEELFRSCPNKLFEFNLQCMQALFELMDLPAAQHFTSIFEKNPKEKDFRGMVDTQLICSNNSRYIQVFENDIGFVHNLNLLDLLFHMGPASKRYLLRLSLESIDFRET